MNPDTNFAEKTAELTRLMGELYTKRKPSSILSWAKDAGLVLPATAKISSPIEELRPMAVGALVRGVAVHAPSLSVSTTTDSGVMTRLDELHAKMDTVTALQKKINAMEESQQFLSDKFEDLKQISNQQAEQIKVLQQQVAKRAVTPPAPAAEQDAVVISGMEESEMETESTERVSEMIHNTMELPGVTVVSVVRLGKQPAAEGRPRKLLVKLSCRQQAVEVLSSARRLKQLNIDRKDNGERPIGINPNLSPAELQHRSSVWKAFTAAKAQNKKIYWSHGYRLYVNDSEVQPGDSV